MNFLRNFSVRLGRRGRCVPSNVLVLSVAALIFVSLAACNDAGLDVVQGADLPPPVKKTPSAMGPRELLVAFKPDVTEQRIAAIFKDVGVEPIAVLRGTHIHHVRLVGEESAEAVLKRLSSMPDVEYAESNYVYRFQKQE